MAAYIGRLGAIGIGKETTSGTSVAPTAWIPFETGEMKPVIESIKDTGAYGVIDEVYDSKVTKNMSEVNISGILRSNFAGDILNGTLGTSSSPVDNSDGTYTHDFTVKNDNTPISYTSYLNNPIGDSESTYCVFDSTEFNIVSGDYVKFDTTLKGKAMAVPGTNRDPAFTSQEEFLAANASIKFADDLAGLDSATTSELKNTKIKIEKNVVEYQSIGSVDVTSLHNQQLNVSGDLEALFKDTVLRDYVLNNTKKSMRIEVVSSNVIGTGSQKATLTIDCPRVSFSDWGSSNDSNGLTSQTLGFSGEFSISDGKTISAQLINTQDTQY